MDKDTENIEKRNEANLKHQNDLNQLYSDFDKVVRSNQIGISLDLDELERKSEAFLESEKLGESKTKRSGRDYVKDFINAEMDVILSEPTRIPYKGNYRMVMPYTAEEKAEVLGYDDEIEKLEQSRKKSLFQKGKFTAQIESLRSKKTERAKTIHNAYEKNYKTNLDIRNQLLDEMGNEAPFSEMVRLNTIIEQFYNQCVEKEASTREWITTHSDVSMKALEEAYAAGGKSDMDKKMRELYDLNTQVIELSKVKEMITSKIMVMDDKEEKSTNGDVRIE